MSTTWNFTEIDYPRKFPHQAFVYFERSVTSLSDADQTVPDRITFTIGPTFISSPSVKRTIYFRLENQEEPENATLQEQAAFINDEGLNIRVYLDNIDK